MSLNEVPVHAYGIDQGINNLCHASWSCQLTETLTDLWPLILAGVLTFGLVAVLSNIRTAAETVDGERSRIVAERDAFRAFAQRVNGLSPDSRITDGGSRVGPLSVAGTESEPSPGLSKVREAYRESVMAVPHYDKDYGTALSEHMAVELGTDVAGSVKNGQRLSSMLQRLIVSKATTAATNRERLIDRLDREASDLKSALDTLSEVESQLADYDPTTLHRVDYTNLNDRWNRLDAMEERCSETLKTRQRLLQQRDDNLPQGPSFGQYVYGALQVDFPVLADGAAVVEHIEEARQALANAAARRG